MPNIDDTDRRILRKVQADSDLSLDALSAEVGLSRNACWRRLKLLQDAGVIKRRVALLDAGKLGLGLTVFIQVRAATHTADWSENFARVARALPEIQAVHRMSGDLDYLLRARVADMAGYDALYQKLIKRVSMADVSASFVMEDIKDTTELPI